MSNNMIEQTKNLKNNITIINQGYTSSTFTSPFLFVKYVTSYKNFNVYEREKYIGTILKNFDWFPNLLYSDDINQFFVYSNVGVPVTIKNKPDDFEKQFNKILEDMKSVNVQHNDIKIGEILIDENNKIYLCDFGWGSINNDLGCGIGLWSCNNKNKPGGYFDDKTTLKRLNFIDNKKIKNIDMKHMTTNDKPYKDPKRKIGSQSETPKINFEGDNIIVSGYQKFAN